MDAAPAQCCSQWLLGAVEAEFMSLRDQPPDLPAAFEAALSHAAGPAIRDRFASAGHRISAAMDEFAEQRGELFYHNRHHVAEAVLAMGWLVRAALRLGAIDETDAALGVVAMVGHDLLHDGSPPNGGVLEARSAAAVAEITAHAGLTRRESDVLSAVIIGTDPFRVASNAARAACDLPPGPLGTSIDRVVAMANEADVFASLMPIVGWQLSSDLARERRIAGDRHADELTTHRCRLGFLSTYGRLSPAAHALGVAELRRSQLDAYTSFGTTREAGAASLDRMPRDEARHRYLTALGVDDRTGNNGSLRN